MARKRRKRRFSALIEYLDHRLGPHRGDGPEYQFWCPFCIDRIGSDSEGRKLWINIDGSKLHCFRCDYGQRDFIRFFRDLNGGALRFEELALLKGERTPPERDVASTVHEILLSTVADDIPPKPLPLPPENIRLAPHVLAKQKPLPVRRAFRYLTERRVTARQIVQFDLGFCPSGRYAQRITFPVYQNGQQVYFTNRYCGTHRLKSLNPPKADGMHARSTCLLNYDNVIGQPRIGVVEGPFDTMAFPDAVGLMGKFISPTQVALIQALVKQGLEEVIVCLDAEAVRDAERVYDRLVRRVPCVRVLQLDRGDPDERRADLPALLDTAGVPSLRSRVRSRLRKEKH